MSYNRNCKWFSMEYVGNPGAVPFCYDKNVLEFFDCSKCEVTVKNDQKKPRTNADRIRAMTDEEQIETNIFDIEENHYNCTVQILKNSITGEVSIGWWEETDDSKTIP